MKLRSVFVLMVATLLVACEKEAGEGGTSTIKGVVITQEWNGTFTTLRDKYPAQAEDVYIIYGDDDYFGDKVTTNYNGVYEFKYLRDGHYTVYVYSKDASINYDVSDQRIVVKKEIDITGKNQTVVVDTLYVKE
jgi:hypothetical protein